MPEVCCNPPLGRKPSIQILMNKFIVVEMRIGGVDAIYLFSLSRAECFIWIETPNAFQ